MAKSQLVSIGSLALNEKGAFKIGPFGSALKKSELVNSGIPVVGIENILENKFVKGFRRFITNNKFNELSDYEIKPDDVLVTTMGTIGRAAVVPSKLERAIFDSHLFRMRLDTDRAFPAYICHIINSTFVADQLTQLARGSIMDGLNTKILRECIIPLPSLDDQIRTAAILDKANRLRTAYKYMFEANNNLLADLFLDMFGDPVLNDKKWPTSILEDHILFLTSGSRGWASYYTKKGDVFLRIQNVGYGRLLMNEITYVEPPNTAEARRTKVQTDDVLLSITADLGRSARIPSGFPTAYINQHLALLRTKNINARFLAVLLSCEPVRKEWDRVDRDAVKSGLNFDDIRNFRIILPPSHLQTQFASSAEYCDKMRQSYLEGMRQTESLFHALLYEAFSGEN